MSTVQGGRSPARSSPPSPPRKAEGHAGRTPLPARQGDEGGGGSPAPWPAEGAPQPIEGAPPDAGGAAAPAGAGAGSEAVVAEPATAQSAAGEAAGA
mmetsp:Transcript_10169/g.23621  ORF Transcript_10169/g.23621 Transcript_10169/m.23621 type:complete len:97 (-) Transcript_10169:106-396(-)